MSHGPGLRPPTVVDRLRSENRPAHESLHVALGFLDTSVDPGRYAALLRRWYGVHAVLEPRLDRWHRRTGLLDWPQRRRLHLLEADLEALGDSRRSRRRLPLCPGLPSVDDTSRALGVLYVVEGATLGGAVLSRRLRDSRVPADARRFLAGYGDQVGPRWSGLRATTSAWVGDDPGREDAVAAAARETFAVLERWLPVPGPS